MYGVGTLVYPCREKPLQLRREWLVFLIKRRVAITSPRLRAHGRRAAMEDGTGSLGTSGRPWLLKLTKAA